MEQDERTVYVSLVKDFLCCYLKVDLKAEGFETEHNLRLHLNMNLRNWWCSIYPDLTCTKHDYRPPTIYGLQEFKDKLKESPTLWEATQKANQKHREAL